MLQKIFSLTLISGFVLLTFCPFNNRIHAKGIPGFKHNTRSIPDFTLKDTAGNSITLSSFRGKFVIISMTADWCGPCKQEIEPTRRMQHYLSDTNIVWIFISFDRDAETWRDVSRNNHLKGLFLWGKPQSDYLKDLFKFNSIPYYIWIDKNGEVAVDNAPRPSSRMTLEELKYYIK